MGNKLSNLTYWTNPNSDFDYTYLQRQPDLHKVQLNEQNNKIINLDFSGNFVEENVLKKTKKNVKPKKPDINTLQWEKIDKKLDRSVLRGLQKSDKVIWIKGKIAEEGRIKWIGRINGGLFAGLQLKNHVTVTLLGLHPSRDLKLPGFNCKKKRGPAVVLLSQVIPYEHFLQICHQSASGQQQHQQSDSQNDNPGSPSLIDLTSSPNDDSMALQQSKVGWNTGDRVNFHKKNQRATVIFVGVDDSKEKYAIIEYDNPVGDPNLIPTSDIKFKRGHGKKVALLKLWAETFIESPGESNSTERGQKRLEPVPFNLNHDVEMTDMSMSENSPDLASKLCKPSNLEKISDGVHRMELKYPGNQGTSSQPTLQSSDSQRKQSLKTKTKVPKLDKHSKPYNRAVNPYPEAGDRALLDSSSIPDLQRGIQSRLQQKQQQRGRGFTNGHQYANSQHPLESQPSSSKTRCNPRGRGSRAPQPTNTNHSLEANHANREDVEHPTSDSEEIDSVEGGVKVGEEVIWFSDEDSCLPFNGTIKKIFKCSNGFEAIVDFKGVTQKDTYRLKPLETRLGYRVNLVELISANSGENGTPENGNSNHYSPSSSQRGYGKGNKRQKLLDENENLIISPDEPLAPHITEDQTDAFGMRKGISGQSNSCYLDATLFSLFYCTNTFDNMLLTPTADDEPKIKEYKTCLRNIVQILRRNRFVPGHVVMNFRKLIGHFNSAILGRFMDAEDLLFIIFGEAFKVPHFFEYTTDMSDYIHQIWSEPGQVATVQQLYEHSMEFWGNLKLKSVPSPALILQMPRNDGKLNFKRIIPNLQLDLSKVMDGHYFCPCDNPVEIKCSSCTQEATGYCINCVAQAGVFHESLGHEFQEQHVSKKSSSNLKMNLVAVICVGYNHYTSFVKCGSNLHSPWLFFDSAGPQICLIQDMAHHIECLEKQPELNDGNCGGFKTRILTDCHLCIYTA